MAKLLIIEPDKPLRETYCKALEADGHEVVAVASAEAAINACEKARPELIILELQLQGHGGVEFLYEFRSYSEWRNVPLLLHTLVPRHVLKPYQAAFKLLNIHHYAYKPATSLRQLLRLVDQTALRAV